jgi:D-cysteine desulfhydrase family pyridoxal phosphate-dependent enzyme
MEAPRLAAALGVPRLLIKRDDLTPLGLGGNKVRKLEFLLARALAESCDTLVTTGIAQSNSCLQVAAAACRLGLRAVLVLCRARHTVDQGNLLLDRLFGADVRLVDCPNADAQAAALDVVVGDLRRAGARAFVLPAGVSTPLAAMGYAVCAEELVQQLRAASVPTAAVVFSSGTGGTQAGLQLGIRLLGAPHRLVGISNGPTPARLSETITRLIEAIARDYGLPVTADSPDVRGEYVGDGYGVPTPEGDRAIVLAARAEGIVLDPVYTGKALAGLADIVARGEVGRHEVPVFLHTGGSPIVFAYHEEITGAIRRSS